jgi:hypothetical protein
MAKAKFERSGSTATIGTIGHVDHGKTLLLAVMAKVLVAPPSFPDRVAVWNWDGFRQSLQAAQTVVMSDPATKQPDTFMGVRIILDDTLASGTVELRSGKEVVRVINLNPN